jgi:hypothetical protein
LTGDDIIEQVNKLINITDSIEILICQLKHYNGSEDLDLIKQLSQLILMRNELIESFDSTDTPQQIRYEIANMFKDIEGKYTSSEDKRFKRIVKLGNIINAIENRKESDLSAKIYTGRLS